MSEEPIRVLLAKVGLDGHDRGVKVVARTLRDAGMDVIYTGLHRSPEEVVAAAIQEDVDVIGVSLLSGAHMTLFPRIIDLMKEQETRRPPAGRRRRDPRRGRRGAQAMGVDEIMLQDTPPDAIVDLVRRMVAERGCAVDGGWTFPPRYDDAYCRRRTGATGSRSARRWTRPSATRAILERLREVCAYASSARPSTARKWGDFHPRTDLATLEDFERGAGDHQGRSARRPGRAPAVRRLHLHRARADVVHIHGTPRHHRPPDGVRDRPRRLGRDRQRPRADHVGHGHPPGRHRLHRRDLQPLHGLVGDALRRRAPRRHRVPVRRRRAGQSRARSTGWRQMQARAPSTARRRTRCTWPRSPPRRASTRATSGCG